MSSNRKSKVLTGAVAVIGLLSMSISFDVTKATTKVDSSAIVVNGRSNEVGFTKEGSNVNIKSNYGIQEIPYFYYWTDSKDVYVNWDYGRLANRPDKIEAVIDSNLDFSNPRYVEVKPKGAEFSPNISGDFYLRVRFFDSFGGITHQSIRKVIRSPYGETREIKGLKYDDYGTGIKLSWSKFVDGIKYMEVYINNSLVNTVYPSTIENDTYVISNIPNKAEVRLKIVNQRGMEYNGVVFVNKSNVKNEVILGVSNDGAGIKVDLSKTGFKTGDKFLIEVIDKKSKDTVVSKSNYELKGSSFDVYPDADKMFLNGQYVVNITDVNTGEIYTYDYVHKIKSVSDFASVGLPEGAIVSAWNGKNGSSAGKLIWSTSPDFSNSKSVEVKKGDNGVSFNTKLEDGIKVYLMLNTYDDKGRIVTQDIDSVVTGEKKGKLYNFKGVFKTSNSAQFTWDELETEISKAIVKINNKYTTLSKLEIDNLNKTNSTIVDNLKKGQAYSVNLYLISKDGKVYEGNLSSIQTSENESNDVITEGAVGLYGRYNPNAGVVTLVLDEGAYDIKNGSTIEVLVDGKVNESIKGTYIYNTGSINITGFVPTKSYKTVSINYEDNNGNKKSISIDSLVIRKGGNIDTFLVNAYDKALSRNINNIDEDGYNYWRKGLISKNISLSYFIRNLIFVPEFKNLLKSPEDLITRLYAVLVLREPDPQGLKFWRLVYDDLINKGVSSEQAVMKMLTDMTTSGEFVNLAGRLSVNP